MHFGYSGAKPVCPLNQASCLHNSFAPLPRRQFNLTDAMMMTARARDGDGAPREERKRSIHRDAHADTDAAVADTATFRAENIGGAKSPRYASHFFPLRIWSWCQILLRKNVGRRKVRGPQQNTNVDPNGGTSPCRVKCCVHNKFALQRDHHHHRAGCLP